MTARPLAGLRVVEAATLFAAPLAGMLLADFGAEVIKIEHPSRPDPARGHGPGKDGIGLWFKSLARNKRLMTLDLSRPEGAALFLRLAERADVVLENFRPGTLERWGVGWSCARWCTGGNTVGAWSTAGRGVGRGGRPAVPGRGVSRAPGA